MTPSSTLPAEGVLARLRAGTAEAHATLEAKLDIITAVASRPGRTALVNRFWRLHLSAEQAVRPWLEDMAELEFAERRRLSDLRRDLAALGLTQPDHLPACPAPRLASRQAALGLFYVLEGSTLGGRVIRRALEGAGADMVGLSFLDPYGSRAGTMWRRLVSVLEREAPVSDAAAIERTVRGARDGFAFAQQCLCDLELVQ